MDHQNYRTVLVVHGQKAIIVKVPGESAANTAGVIDNTPVRPAGLEQDAAAVDRAAEKAGTESDVSGIIAPAEDTEDEDDADKEVAAIFEQAERAPVKNSHSTNSETSRASQDQSGRDTVKVEMPSPPQAINQQDKFRCRFCKEPLLFASMKQRHEEKCNPSSDVFNRPIRVSPATLQKLKQEGEYHADKQSKCLFCTRCGDAYASLREFCAHFFSTHESMKKYKK